MYVLMNQATRCKQTSALDLALQASIHCTVCYIVTGDLPEGVDPSFLAALPENIRQEVIAEQLRLQRIQARAQQQQSSNTQGAMEVNPEFLAELVGNNKFRHAFQFAPLDKCRKNATPLLPALR